MANIKIGIDANTAVAGALEVNRAIDSIDNRLTMLTTKINTVQREFKAIFSATGLVDGIRRELQDAYRIIQVGTKQIQSYMDRNPLNIKINMSALQAEVAQARAIMSTLQRQPIGGTRVGGSTGAAAINIGGDLGWVKSMDPASMTYTKMDTGQFGTATRIATPPDAQWNSALGSVTRGTTDIQAMRNEIKLLDNTMGRFLNTQSRVNTEQSFMNSRFARFSIIMSGIAASLFVFQQFVQVIRAITSPILDFEKSVTKIRIETALTGEKIAQLMRNARGYSSAGLGKSEEYIAKFREAFDKDGDFSNAIERANAFANSMKIALEGTFTQKLNEFTAAIKELSETVLPPFLSAITSFLLFVTNSIKKDASTEFPDWWNKIFGFLGSNSDTQAWRDSRFGNRQGTPGSSGTDPKRHELPVVDLTKDVIDIDKLEQYRLSAEKQLEDIYIEAIKGSIPDGKKIVKRIFEGNALDELVNYYASDSDPAEATKNIEKIGEITKQLIDTKVMRPINRWIDENIDEVIAGYEKKGVLNEGIDAETLRKLGTTFHENMEKIYRSMTAAMGPTVIQKTLDELSGAEGGLGIASVEQNAVIQAEIARLKELDAAYMGWLQTLRDIDEEKQKWTVWGEIDEITGGFSEESMRAAINGIEKFKKRMEDVGVDGATQLSVITEKLWDIKRASLAVSDSFKHGAGVAIHDWVKAIQTGAETAYEAVSGLLRKMDEAGADMFSNFIRGGKNQWKEMLDDMMGDWADFIGKMAYSEILKPVFSPILKSVGGMFSNFAGGGSGGLGYAGDGGTDFSGILSSGSSMLSIGAAAKEGIMAGISGLATTGPWAVMGIAAIGILNGIKSMRDGQHSQMFWPKYGKLSEGIDYRSPYAYLADVVKGNDFKPYGVDELFAAYPELGMGDSDWASQTGAFEYHTGEGQTDFSSIINRFERRTNVVESEEPYASFQIEMNDIVNQMVVDTIQGYRDFFKQLAPELLSDFEAAIDAAVVEWTTGFVRVHDDIFAEEDVTAFLSGKLADVNRAILPAFMEGVGNFFAGSTDVSDIINKNSTLAATGRDISSEVTRIQGLTPEQMANEGDAIKELIGSIIDYYDKTNALRELYDGISDSISKTLVDITAYESGIENINKQFEAWREALVAAEASPDAIDALMGKEADVIAKYNEDTAAGLIETYLQLTGQTTNFQASLSSMVEAFDTVESETNALILAEYGLADALDFTTEKMEAASQMWLDTWSSWYDGIIDSFAFKTLTEEEYEAFSNDRERTQLKQQAYDSVMQWFESQTLGMDQAQIDAWLSMNWDNIINGWNGLMGMIDVITSAEEIDRMGEWLKDWESFYDDLTTRYNEKTLSEADYNLFLNEKEKAQLKEQAYESVIEWFNAQTFGMDQAQIDAWLAMNWNDIIRGWNGLMDVIDTVTSTASTFEWINHALQPGGYKPGTDDPYVDRNADYASQLEQNLHDMIDAFNWSLESIINSWEDFNNAITFGSLAPAQSVGTYETEYQRLLTKASSGDVGAYDQLTDFLVNEYLPFAQNYTGGANYADLVAGISDDMTILRDALGVGVVDTALSTSGLSGQQLTVLREIRDILTAGATEPIQLVIDGDQLGYVVAEQIETNQVLANVVLNVRPIAG